MGLLALNRFIAATIATWTWPRHPRTICPVKPPCSMSQEYADAHSHDLPDVLETTSPSAYDRLYLYRGTTLTAWPYRLTEFGKPRVKKRGCKPNVQDGRCSR